MNEDVVKISHILMNLLKWAEVEFIEHSADAVKEIAGYATRRRTRFYFIGKEIKN